MKDYYERLDGSDPLSAVDLLSPSLQFAFVRPEGTLAGGRAELERFIRERPARSHRVLAWWREEDTEVAVGESVDEDGTVLAAFQVVMQLDAAGVIEDYFAAVHPTLRLRIRGDT